MSYILNSSNHSWWTLEDTRTGVSISFKEHLYEETKVVSIDNKIGATAGKSAEESSLMISEITDRMTDYLMTKHYYIAMPDDRDPIEKERVRIGELIKSLRKEKGINQGDLAIKAGITQANVSNIETGRYSAGLDVLSRIADALGAKIQIVKKD